MTGTPVHNGRRAGKKNVKVKGDFLQRAIGTGKTKSNEETLNISPLNESPRDQKDPRERANAARESRERKCKQSFSGGTPERPWGKALHNKIWERQRGRTGSKKRSRTNTCCRKKD